MTKKDYILLSKIFKITLPKTGKLKYGILLKFCLALSNDNINFKPYEFLISSDINKKEAERITRICSYC